MWTDKTKVPSIKMGKPKVREDLRRKIASPHFTITLRLKEIGFLFIGIPTGPELHCHSILARHLAFITSVSALML